MLRGSYLEGEIRELQQGLRESLGSAAVEAEMEQAAWSAEQAEEYGHRLEAQINEICQENWSGFVQLLKRRESGEASVVRRVDKLECEAAAMSRAPVQESPTTSNSMPPPPRKGFPLSGQWVCGESSDLGSDPTGHPVDYFVGQAAAILAKLHG